MVQIGKFHIGAAEKAKESILTCGEANVLWNHLDTRYKIIEKTQIWEQLVHDPDFKFFIRKELKQTLEKQVDELENIMNKFKMPLPGRPPKSVNMEVNTEIFDDKFIFGEIITGVENYMNLQLHAFRTCISNDSLRKLFMELTFKEMEIFDDLCKYGKLKGWLSVAPLRHS